MQTLLRKLVIGKSDALAFLLLFVALFSVEQWSKVPLLPTAGWWIAFAAFLTLCFLLRPKIKGKPYRVPIITIFLLIVGLSCIYGALFKAENYWDWKNLIGNLFVFLLPLASYTYSQPKVLTRSIVVYLLIACILIVPVLLFTKSDAMGRFLAPFCLLALFLPYLDKGTALMVLVAYAVTIVFGHESRSDIIKFTFALLLGIMLIVPKVRKGFLAIRKLLYLALMVAPVLFVILAATGTFNIFQLDEELGINGKYQMKAEQYAAGETSALNDTRTFIYLEEINSAVSNGYVLQGRSPARGYDSDYFGGSIDADLGTNRGERSSCEVSILNIFNYFGAVGVIIYFLIFALASFKAVFRSRNSFMPSVGLFVAFRWCFAWIEDFTKFDLNFLFLWISIGMCFSPVFRSMNNAEFKKWTRTLKITYVK